MVQWLSGETGKLEFLHMQSTAAPWLDLNDLRSAASLIDLKREFARALQMAWPSALVRALAAFQRHPSRAAKAVVLEPDPSCKEPREIIAQWPFAVRVKSIVEHAGDISRIFIKVCLRVSWKWFVVPHSHCLWWWVPERATERRSGVLPRAGGSDQRQVAHYVHHRPRHQADCVAVLGSDELRGRDLPRASCPSWRCCQCECALSEAKMIRRSHSRICCALFSGGGGQQRRRDNPSGSHIHGDLRVCERAHLPPDELDGPSGMNEPAQECVIFLYSKRTWSHGSTCSLVVLGVEQLVVVYLSASARSPPRETAASAGGNHTEEAAYCFAPFTTPTCAGRMQRELSR